MVLLRFSPINEEIQQIAYSGSMPSLSGPTVLSYNNSIYVIGGYSITDNTIQYNPHIYCLNITTLSWNITTLLNNNYPRIAGGIITNNSIILLHGKNFAGKVNIITQINLENLQVTNLLSEYSTFDYAYAINSMNMYIFGGKEIDYINRLIQFNSSSLGFSVISEDYAFPPSRKFQCIEALSGNLYMFGGKSGEQVFSDMWKFTISGSNWTELFPSGEVPTARWKAASASEGDNMFIFGGVEDQYCSDLYMYMLSSNTWTKLTSSSAFQPLPMISSCALYYNQKIYLYGGIYYETIIDELWSFDLKLSEYTLESNSGLFFKHNTCHMQDGYIYIISSNETSKYLTIYDIDSRKWRKSYPINNSNIGSIDLIILDTIFTIGGLLYENTVSNTIQIYNISSKELKIFQSNFSFQNAGYAYFGNFLYLIGGNLIIENVSSFALTSKQMIRIDLFQYYSENICSKGSFFYLGQCLPCNPGTYSENPYASACLNCPEGTYSTEHGLNSIQGCYFCDTGFWNNSTGQSFCRECPINKYCPFGSINPSTQYALNSINSYQPVSYSQDYSVYTYYTDLMLYASAVLFFLIILSLLFSKNLREKLHNTDMYTTKHNHKLLVPMYIKTTNVGGFCTLLFIFIAINFASITLMKYYLANLVETRTLVPFITRPDGDMVESDMTISVQLYYYPGNCTTSEGLCSKSLSLTFASITGVKNFSC